MTPAGPSSVQAGTDPISVLALTDQDAVQDWPRQDAARDVELSLGASLGADPAPAGSPGPQEGLRETRME